jgi:pimeloyl-ACP methyl ester carboxylesterase
MNRLWPVTVAAVIAALILGPGEVSRRAAAQSTFSEEGGTLPDGTVFLMRVPAKWNRILIRDLDFARGANNPRYQSLLEQGYAVSGTQRHRLRMYQYDPAREIANLDKVLDRFESRFGKPDRVIQFGCSGGGHVTLAVAEDFSDRIDGAIALAAHTPVWLMNTYLDGWFVLKVLIGSNEPTELVIANLPSDATYNPSGHGVIGAIPAAWRAAIDRAQRTAEGRARIALAFTIGQWPAWVNSLTPQPDLEDVEALQHAMYHAVYQNAANPGGEARIMFENAANGQQLSWNTGVDYREFFENGNEYFKRAVRRLYEEARLNLDADLEKLNGAPRIAASPHALEFWKAAGRTVRGNPKIPVLRMHEVGDYQIPPSLVEGYDAQIRANGKDALYRTAFVNGDAHCGFNVAETAAAVETMIRRLDSGRWPSTDPDHLNKLGASLVTGVTPRFISIEKHRQMKYNRVWVP